LLCSLDHFGEHRLVEVIIAQCAFVSLACSGLVQRFVLQETQALRCAFFGIAPEDGFTIFLIER
jgi:hypothetical protein